MSNMCQCKDCPLGSSHSDIPTIASCITRAKNQIHVGVAKAKVGMDVFLKNAKNFVSNFFTGKKMVCRERLEEIEDRVKAVEARIESWNGLGVVVPETNLEKLTSHDSISSASDCHFSIIRKSYFHDLFNLVLE
jgi:hypothetical protein